MQVPVARTETFGATRAYVGACMHAAVRSQSLLRY